MPFYASGPLIDSDFVHFLKLEKNESTFWDEVFFQIDRIRNGYKENSFLFLAIPDLDVVQVKGSNTERWNTKQNTGSLECNGGSYLDINPNGEVLRIIKKYGQMNIITNYFSY